MIKRSLLLLFFILIPSISCAAITFDGNGRWESTYDCPEQDGYSNINCDGITGNANNTCSGGQGEQITSAANYSSGGGGRGQRTWWGGTKNDNSGGTLVIFPSRQNELWVRWYTRFSTDITIGQNYHNKMLYFSNASQYVGDDVVFGFDETDKYRFWMVGTTSNIYQSSAGYGFNDIFTDGSWHAIEVYVLADTNGSDGIIRAWVDGTLILEETGINTASNSGGWLSFEFPTNHEIFTNASCQPQDVDDIVVYNQTPPNTDADGNAFIGTLGASSGPSDPVTGLTKGTQLFSESFENDSWTSRSWYDGTSSTGTESGGYSGNALKWEWASSVTTPTGFSTIRNNLTQATDEFLIEYYVKLDTGWQGSGQTYHPHFLGIMSEDDTDYQQPASSNSHLYFELLSDTSSPYTTYTNTLHQDTQRTNDSNGTPPVDLTSVTETRSANQCNTPYAESGATGGDCYNDGTDYSSWNRWKGDVSVPVNEWVKITSYIKSNTVTGGVANFDGILKTWVNDSLAVSSETVQFVTGAYDGKKWDKIILFPYIGDGSPISQSMWIDELEVWSIASTPSANITVSGSASFR